MKKNSQVLNLLLWELYNISQKLYKHHLLMLFIFEKQESKV